MHNTSLSWPIYILKLLYKTPYFKTLTLIGENIGVDVLENIGENNLYNPNEMNL